MSVARLDEVARKSSDTEWARTMVTARGALLRRCHSEVPQTQTMEL
jgi:hypothetical protein